MMLPLLDMPPCDSAKRALSSLSYANEEIWRMKSVSRRRFAHVYRRARRAAPLRSLSLHLLTRESLGRRSTRAEEIAFARGHRAAARHRPMVRHQCRTRHRIGFIAGFLWRQGFDVLRSQRDLLDEDAALRKHRARLDCTDGDVPALESARSRRWVDRFGRWRVPAVTQLALG